MEFKSLVRLKIEVETQLREAFYAQMAKWNE